MKSVVFKKISIKNFLSIGEEEVVLNISSGISLITGENKDAGGRNGVGKSSIIESLYWVLFGSTIRDIKKEKVVHNQSNSTCSVELDFSVSDGKDTFEYKLIRLLNPSKLSLFKDSVDCTLSTMPKTDELIKELIGANEEVFQNAVIMTANNTMPFMAQKKIDKRKFVEGILNLGIFGEMLLKVRSKYNELKKENDILATTFSNHQKYLSLYNSQLEKNKKTKEEKILALNQKLNTINQKVSQNCTDIENSIIEKEKVITSINEKTDTIKKAEEKINLLIEDNNKILWNFDFEIKNLKKELSNIKQSNGSCPTCKRKYENQDSDPCIDIERVEKSIEEQEYSRSKSEKDLITLKDKKTKILSLLSDNNKTINSTKSEIQELKLLVQEIKNIKEKNDEINQEIIKVQNEKDDTLDLIENIKKDISDTETKLEEIQKELLILETAKFVVSEEGVKSFIVKKILNILNTQLNFYLKTLNAPCTCVFDEVFEETIYNNQGKECSYFNFSGGERKRIDVAVLFMFQDILRMQTGVSFNLSMYDELFDSALDEKGVSNIMDILKGRFDSEAIFIISHNKAAFNSEFNNIIQLQKINGKTSVVS